MNKSLDCVEMKNTIQEELYKKLNASQPEEYFIKLRQYLSSSDFVKEIREKQKDYSLVETE
ncbi:MAG: hypothetical protein HY960_01065 [Ignavibacteriae bacterium]|nr:hypothetical protein [Ignavibacteriota bacterium]